MKVLVKSIEDVNSIVPLLEEKPKFRKTLKSFIDMGNEFSIEVAPDFSHFTSASNKKYKYRITTNSKAMYLSNVKYYSSNQSESTLNLSFPFMNVKLSDNQDYVGSITINGVKEKCVNTFTEKFQEIGWGEICRCVGILFKELIVDTECCSKCGGEGKIRAFMHIAEGTCFQCMGIGKWFVVPNKIAIKNI